MKGDMFVIKDKIVADKINIHKAELKDAKEISLFNILMAKETEGKYFRATNNKKLAEIYKEINKLEKTEVEETKYYNYDEKYRPLILIAGLLLLIELLLRNTIFRSFV